MNEHKRLRSLRRLVFIFAGASLLLFAVALFTILYTTIPDMTRKMESHFLRKQCAVVSGLFEGARKNLYAAAANFANSGEMSDFIAGKRMQSFKSVWSDETVMGSCRFNFLIVQDAAGETLYAEFYNYAAHTPADVPAGFAGRLAPMTRDMVAGHVKPLFTQGDTTVYGNGGILIHQGQAHLLAGLPVKNAANGKNTLGAVFMGCVLDDSYLKTLTRFEDVSFQFMMADRGRDYRPSVMMTDDTTAVAAIPFAGIGNESLVLTMSEPRTLYGMGRSVLSKTIFLLFSVTMVLALALYCIIARFTLRPIEAMKRDIPHIRINGGLNPKKYSNSLEIASLCTSINELFYRMRRSNISLDLFQRILSGTDIFLYVSDLETDTVLFVNDNMKRHFGLDDSVIGKTCWKVFQKDFTARCGFCPVRQIEKNPDAHVVWEEFNPITGKYYRNIGSMIEWTDGRLAHLQHRVDISDLKQTEAALKKRLEQQEIASAIAQSFIGRADFAAMIGNALTMCGEFMSVDRILLNRIDSEKDILEVVHEWTAPDWSHLRLLGETVLFASGTPLHEALAVRKASFVAYESIQEHPELADLFHNGTKGFVAIPVYADGGLWGLLGFDACRNNRSWTESDIHLGKLIASLISGLIARETAEGDLARLTSLVESSPQYIAYISPGGEFKYLNEGALNLLGYTFEEMKNHGLEKMLGLDKAREMRQENIPRILREGWAELEMEVIRRDGERRVMSFTAFATRNKTAGIGVTGLDITEHRALEKQFVAAKEVAESSSRAKGEFLSHMSHEIRTPLNAIIGMTGLAKASSGLERKDYCLDKIENASTHLLGVINNILDMSKIEANKFEVSATEFNFEEMLIRTVNVLNFRTEEKKQNLSVFLDPGIPSRIVSDGQRLAQVIANLLSNAVKFTPESGTIDLRAELRHREDDDCVIKVSVTDTGIGIPEELRQRLFKPFEQADGDVARRFGGTGLGLAISKHIVGMMDGEIWVTSEKDKGSTFAFTFRARRGQELAPAGGGVWMGLHTLGIGLADRDERVFRAMAESSGGVHEVARHADAALELLSLSGRTRDIVFMDWSALGPEAFDLARHIRETGYARGVVFIISDMAWAGIEHEAAAARVNTFITKPLFPSLIEASIRDCLNPERSGKPKKTVPAVDRRFDGRRILLVEDIDVNREIVIALLDGTGLAVETAENGLEAVAAVEREPEGYDVICMDIHMPKMDGYEATRRIRQMNASAASAIPIIAMTANVFREDVEKCLAAGMNGHIGKPVSLDELLETLGRYMPQS